VNGWSFVKNSRKYYDDCARVLCETILLALRPNHRATLSTVQPLTRNPSVTVSTPLKGSPNSAVTPRREDSNSPMVSDEELLSVVSVIRHGDRTPKQKMKVKLSDDRFLDFFHAHASSPQNNVKLKSKKSLISFLELTKSVISHGPEHIDDKELFAHLLCIRDVLERHKISGINRKLQMKPEKWRDTVVGDDSVDGEQQVVTRAIEIQLILKWGGDLTPLGEQQAIDLGTSFRTSMYPDSSGGGVLRLHSTFRHDLKIKASDEGRVQKTAAAFTKGLLELEGDLTPVLVSLVTVHEKDSQMLDHYDNLDIKQEVSRCKSYINRVLQMDVEFTEDMLNNIAPISSRFMRQALLKLGNPRVTLGRMHGLIGEWCAQIADLRSKEHDESDPSPALYLGETYALMLDRWEKLNRDFFKAKAGHYDLTKVPEVYDMCRYDILHNYHLGMTVMEELFRVSELFADCVVPQEYGIDENEKRTIGVKMCHALLRKIQYDLNIAKSGTQLDMQYLLDLSHGDDLRIRTLGRCVRTRLYFTSESHLYTLLNVLTYPPRGTGSVLSAEGAAVIDDTKELSYLSQISFRLFDNRSKEANDPTKYRCEISFSAGACADPTLEKSVYIAPHVALNRNISCDDLIRSLNLAIAECDSSRGSSSSNGSGSATPTELGRPTIFRNDSGTNRFSG
jgi:inositol-hexakisphosphate/diphosphoinositol-pentakisphosphate 1-kinase